MNRGVYVKVKAELRNCKEENYNCLPPPASVLCADNGGVLPAFLQEVADNYSTGLNMTSNGSLYIL